MNTIRAFKYFSFAMAIHALSVFGDDRVVNGRVLKLLRESPIFERASPTSKIIADADRETVLILRKVSPRGTWLFVEDEDRHRGWVPKSRTDYVDWKKISLEKSSEVAIEKRGAFTEEREGSLNEEERPRERKQWNHAVAVTGRRSLFDRNGEYAIGLSYSLLTAPQSFGGSTSGEVRAYRSGFQTGFFRTNAGGFSLPLRFRMIAGSSVSSFASGPDIGLWLMRTQAREHKWSFGFGYSVALLPFSSSGLFTSLRAGVDFKEGTRFSYELSVGCFL